MAVYDGVVTVADDDIPVIIELADDLVRLSTGGKEIAIWHNGECQIRHVEDSTFAIEAEDDTLSFVPSQPTVFAAALNGGNASGGSPKPTEPAPAIAPTSRDEAPPPKPVTLGLFYALCALTAGLGVWALISMIF